MKIITNKWYRFDIDNSICENDKGYGITLNRSMVKMQNTARPDSVVAFANCYLHWKIIVPLLGKIVIYTFAWKRVGLQGLLDTVTHMVFQNKSRIVLYSELSD